MDGRDLLSKMLTKDHRMCAGVRKATVWTHWPNHFIVFRTRTPRHRDAPLKAIEKARSSPKTG